MLFVIIDLSEQNGVEGFCLERLEEASERVRVTPTTVLLLVPLVLELEEISW